MKADGVFWTATYCPTKMSNPSGAMPLRSLRAKGGGPSSRNTCRSFLLPLQFALPRKTKPSFSWGTCLSLLFTSSQEFEVQLLFSRWDRISG